ncbi:hypothetical protein XAP412_430026 [Xanthomonas phaseoli pv. phaseoli]|uniref:Uncharacterized protein n=1 Tax=Xanthomonas campestris pv. phaseoli TaxID=317013 RepID=A0AB38E123_XANCH|nr:hypothetical protein XAP6984_480027 [Xanthomonas phaseoli pv. phaseoli]SON85542.1 hypothetical protein XAP412_430026 [Xanthomonas phaseoli pv. phaseoli]SON90170.1 hypothetical protein XAP7430_450029 [Xanthomonas phaseoli pv. phaseoli]SOO28065.1 hypothetical protein XAP6164_2100015 [Xanthomonas phaseoli pv. phaseoli]
MVAADEDRVSAAQYRPVGWQWGGIQKSLGPSGVQTARQLRSNPASGSIADQNPVPHAERASAR